jgi:very-short-patch-repair endonuclease
MADIVSVDELREDYIIPSVFTREVVGAVASAVADEARESGTAAAAGAEVGFAQTGGVAGPARPVGLLRGTSLWRGVTGVKKLCANAANSPKGVAGPRHSGAVPHKRRKIQPAGRLGPAQPESSRSQEEFRGYPVRLLGVTNVFLVRGTRDHRVAAIAARQRGRVARRQLLDAGISTAMIEGMLARGSLYREHAGVYCVGHRAPVRLGRETAALLTYNETAVLSHGSAAALWRVRPESPTIEITLRSGWRPGRDGIHVHHSCSLRNPDLRIHEGLPVTAPARTLLDLAPRLTADQLGWALDEALTGRIMRPSQLLELVSRSNGYRGSAILKAMYEQRTGPIPTRSELEKRFVGLVRAAHLPEPQTNIWLHGFLIDAFWPDHGVVFEIDSHRFHTSRSAFERDRRKEAAVKSAGLDFNRVSDHQLNQEPYAVIAFVTQRLTLRARRGTAG